MSTAVIRAPGLVGGHLLIREETAENGTVYLLGLAVLTGGELSRSDFEFVIPYVVGSLVAAVVVGAFVSRVRRSHQPVRPEVSPTQAQGGHVTGA